MQCVLKLKNMFHTKSLRGEGNDIHNAFWWVTLTINCPTLQDPCKQGQNTEDCTS